MSGERVGFGTRMSTSANLNVDPLWAEYDNGKIRGVEVQIETTENLQALYILEKRGHVDHFVKSDDGRVKNIAVLSSVGLSMSGASPKLAKAIFASHKEKYGKDLYLPVFIDQNYEGYKIYKDYLDEGLPVTLVSTHPELVKECQVYGEYALNKTSRSKLRKIVDELKSVCKQVTGAKKMVNIEQLLGFETCDVAKFMLDLAAAARNK